MRNTYWQRKRDAEKGTIRKISSEKKIEFLYKDKMYLYIYRTDSNSGLAYIYFGKELIFSPYENKTTVLGKEIYEELVKQKIIQNG